MNTLIKSAILLCLLGILCIPQSEAQIDKESFANRTPDGGGEYIASQEVCVTDAERSRINLMLEANIKSLREQNILKPGSRSITLFQWPLAQAPSNVFNNSWAISNYVDQDATSGIEDYNCGARTYDGHRGIDMFTWPFPWYLKNGNLVHAVAAADGTIIGKDDGNEDDHCACSGSWNAVYKLL